MPRMTRWFLKTGLIYFLLSALLLIWMEWPGGGAPPGLQALFYHLLMVGWVTQIIIGVSLWLFPRASRNKPRDVKGIHVAVYTLLNAGLILRALAEPGWFGQQAGWTGPVLVGSALLQWLAVCGYAASIWQRIRRR